MTEQNHVLTDTANNVWLDTFTTSTGSCSIHKHTLRGGPGDGMDVIDVRNGELDFTILPARGMGLWRGSYKGLALGWQSPVQGPVHPRHVNAEALGGIGWLYGFDEMLVRCGLGWNGPPGKDPVNDSALTLHGRIANLPAHRVEAGIGDGPDSLITVTGEVDEGALFLGRLRLTTTYETKAGSSKITIRDRIQNLSASEAEMELLYHCNLGPPFLEAGSKVIAPIQEMAPQTPRAAEGMDDYQTYAGPTPGFAEQVYLYRLVGNDHGRTLALLHNAAGDKGVCVRFDLNQLPCFTVWKNCLPMEDGYVTGLEPATNFPNFKAFEREQGRVRKLAAGESWEAEWSIEVLDSANRVQKVINEIEKLQSEKPILHRTPQATFSPAGT